MVIPCHRYCLDRSANCHCACEKYKTYKEWLEQEKLLKRQFDALYAYKHEKKEEYKRKAKKRRFKGGAQ